MRSDRAKNLMMDNEEAQAERNMMHAKFPCVWEANLVKNGKMIALFDKAQQVRNKYYKFSRNKKEIMLIQTLVQTRKSSLYALDLK